MSMSSPDFRFSTIVLERWARRFVGPLTRHAKTCQLSFALELQHHSHRRREFPSRLVLTRINKSFRSSQTLSQSYTNQPKPSRSLQITSPGSSEYVSHVHLIPIVFLMHAAVLSALLLVSCLTSRIKVKSSHDTTSQCSTTSTTHTPCIIPETAHSSPSSFTTASPMLFSQSSTHMHSFHVFQKDN
ncbi:hypothetical protein BKA64DRAFT_250342 [Cadophora sp. MPI-SDFR-AT-0126]|nr:hypothetical protein BKA64DRAFT_250342 [Leotiomycetes sp. MPI-SDFR-AT-0126]